MSITTQIFCGQLEQQGTSSPRHYEVTCRLVTNQRGLESLHITGWVAVDGARREVALLGLTSPEATMHGRERVIALERIAQLCDSDDQTRST